MEEEEKKPVSPKEVTDAANEITGLIETMRNTTSRLHYQDDTTLNTVKAIIDEIITKKKPQTIEEFIYLLDAAWWAVFSNNADYEIEEGSVFTSLQKAVNEDGVKLGYGSNLDYALRDISNFAKNRKFEADIANRQKKRENGLRRVTDRAAQAIYRMFGDGYNSENISSVNIAYLKQHYSDSAIVKYYARYGIEQAIATGILEQDEHGNYPDCSSSLTRPSSRM